MACSAARGRLSLELSYVGYLQYTYYVVLFKETGLCHVANIVVAHCDCDGHHHDGNNGGTTTKVSCVGLSDTLDQVIVLGDLPEDDVPAWAGQEPIEAGAPPHIDKKL